VIYYAISDSGYKVDIRALFAETLKALTGQDVILRFEESPSKGAYGSLIKDPAGHLVVFISEAAPLETQYELLLHEAAHIVLGHAAHIAPSNLASVPPQSVINPFRGQPGTEYQAAEDAAHALQAEWSTYAQNNAWKVIQDDWKYSGMNLIALKLKCLQTLKGK
jgi:hypothetical protein